MMSSNTSKPSSRILYNEFAQFKNIGNGPLNSILMRTASDNVTIGDLPITVDAGQTASVAITAQSSVSSPVESGYWVEEYFPQDEAVTKGSWYTPLGVSKVEVTAVGGGGGGHGGIGGSGDFAQGGGGGGSGGIKTQTLNVKLGDKLDWSIGYGGGGGVGNNNGSSGDDTKFGSVTGPRGKGADGVKGAATSYSIVQPAWQNGSGPRNVYGTAEYCVLNPAGVVVNKDRYTFYLNFDQVGTYHFSGSADNQAKFYIDDVLAFQALDWGSIATGTYTVTQAGFHKVGIYYYSDGAGGSGFGIQIDYPDNSHFWQTSKSGVSKNGSRTSVYQIVKTLDAQVVPIPPNPIGTGFYTRTGLPESNSKAAGIRQWWVVINGSLVYNSTTAPTKYTAGAYQGSTPGYSLSYPGPSHTDSINAFNFSSGSANGGEGGAGGNNGTDGDTQLKLDHVGESTWGASGGAGGDVPDWGGGGGGGGDDGSNGDNGGVPGGGGGGGGARYGSSGKKGNGGAGGRGAIKLRYYVATEGYWPGGTVADTLTLSSNSEEGDISFPVAIKRASHGYKIFTNSDTWSPPSGYNGTVTVEIQGGAGGKGGGFVVNDKRTGLGGKGGQGRKYTFTFNGKDGQSIRVYPGNNGGDGQDAVDRNNGDGGGGGGNGFSEFYSRQGNGTGGDGVKGNYINPGSSYFSAGGGGGGGASAAAVYDASNQIIGYAMAGGGGGGGGSWSAGVIGKDAGTSNDRASSQLMDASNGNWSAWMNKYACWPTADMYDIDRRFQFARKWRPPYTGLFYYRFVADNEGGGVMYAADGQSVTRKDNNTGDMRNYDREIGLDCSTDGDNFRKAFSKDNPPYHEIWLRNDVDYYIFVDVYNGVGSKGRDSGNPGGIALVFYRSEWRKTVDSAIPTNQNEKDRIPYYVIKDGIAKTVEHSSSEDIPWTLRGQGMPPNELGLIRNGYPGGQSVGDAGGSGGGGGGWIGGRGGDTTTKGQAGDYGRQGLSGSSGNSIPEFRLTEDKDSEKVFQGYIKITW